MGFGKDRLPLVVVVAVVVVVSAVKPTCSISKIPVLLL